jgi:hypothetical protein
VGGGGGWKVDPATGAGAAAARRSLPARRRRPPARMRTRTRRGEALDDSSSRKARRGRITRQPRRQLTLQGRPADNPLGMRVACVQVRPSHSIRLFWLGQQLGPAGRLLGRPAGNRKPLVWRSDRGDCLAQSAAHGPSGPGFDPYPMPAPTRYPAAAAVWCGHCFLGCSIAGGSAGGPPLRGSAGARAMSYE